jgi:hypothetical protein
MTDKVVNLTYGGSYNPPGGSLIDISVSGTNLNQNNATYVMDINTVCFGGSSIHLASRDIIYASRINGSNLIAHGDNIWARGDLTVSAGTPSGDIIRIFLYSATAGSGVVYRCFITAYVKDNVA